MQPPARLLAVALGAMSVLPAPAIADDTVVRGSVQDPRGDAYVDSHRSSPEVADLKRVVVTYDRAAGVFQIKTTVWSGLAPESNRVKQFNAFRDCSPSSTQALYYDLAAWFRLLITPPGFPPPPSPYYAYEREIHGNHVMETWSGPLLRQLDVGCVTNGRVVTGGFDFPDSSDAFDTVELR